FHIAQQIIPAAQLVPKFQSIGRCNNYAMLQSIPCSPECKIMGQILLDHPLSYALAATADVPVGKKKKQSVGETSSPRKSLKVTIKQKQVDEGEKDEESYASKFAASMLHHDVDDSKNRLEPRSHNENPEYVDDDDENEKEKKDEKKDDVKDKHNDDHINHVLVGTHEIGSLENRTEKMQTPILITPRSPRINLSSDKNIASDLALWDVLKRKFKKSSTSNTSCRDDDFHSQHHDDHQEYDAPPEGEKRQQYQQQEWDAWEEETVIDADEVIPEDETPELIIEFHNVDKRMSHPEKGRNMRRDEGLIVLTQDII
ncbi:hypothetical protein Tco_0110835, partial [Tanacetum coccineum]